MVSSQWPQCHECECNYQISPSPMKGNKPFWATEIILSSHLHPLRFSTQVQMWLTNIENTSSIPTNIFLYPSISPSAPNTHINFWEVKNSECPLNGTVTNLTLPQSCYLGSKSRGSIYFSSCQFFLNYWIFPPSWSFIVKLFIKDQLHRFSSAPVYLRAFLSCFKLQFGKKYIEVGDRTGKEKCCKTIDLVWLQVRVSGHRCHPAESHQWKKTLIL